MNNDTTFGLDIYDFQSESDNLYEDQIVLNDETPAQGMLIIPCHYCFEATFHGFQSEYDDQNDGEIVLATGS